MSTASSIPTTPGAGVYVATYSVSESGVTKQLQRIVIVDSAGAEVDLAAATPVTDNSGSLTVDAPVATPVFVRLSDGAAAITTLNVGHGKTIKTVSGTLTVDTDVIPAVSLKRIKVIAYSFITTGTNLDLILFKSDGTGGTEVARIILQSSASNVFGANLSIPAPSFLFATDAGKKLTVDVNQTDNIHYFITYFDDDAT